MHEFNSRALAHTLSNSRWRAAGAAVAIGVAGPALFIVPAFATTDQVPVGNDDTYAIVQNAPTVLNVLGNDTDSEGDALAIQSVSTPAHGIAALAAGVLTYTPTAGYLGADSFTYTLTDGHGNYDTATVTLNIAVTVGIPVAADDTATVAMNTTSTINVLSNDTDPNSDTLTITSVSMPAHGTAAIVNGTSISYMPNAGYTGTDTFSYVVDDGHGSSDIATVTLTVSPVGDAPIVQNDAINVVVGTPTVLNVLANDSDPNGNTLTITSVTTPGHGTATITGSASTITYVPVAGYVGADAFGYTVTDGNGNTATGSVTITVAAVNTLTAADDSATVKAGKSKEISVLKNDVSANGSTSLLVTSVSAPAHGTAVIKSDGKTVVYTPVDGYVGADTFTYTVLEAGGASASANVNITVQQSTIGNDDDKCDCKNGGWLAKEFHNQGLCIAAFNHWMKGHDHQDDRGAVKVDNDHKDSDHKDKQSDSSDASKQKPEDKSSKSDDKKADDKSDKKPGWGQQIKASLNVGHGNDDHDDKKRGR